MTANVTLQQWQAAQQEERGFWNSYAETYSRYPQILLEHLGKLRDVGEFIKSDLSAGSISAALEVGVGPLGIGVLGMQRSDFHITAIDPLPRIELEISDEPLRKYFQTLREGVVYQTVQGESLPFDDESFDFVCCHNVIDHTQSPIRILQEIHRVLKVRCNLFLTLHTFSFFGRMKFEILRKLQSDKMIFVCHPHSFLHVDILRALQRIGYETLRHDGGESPLIGRGRFSRFLCRKST